MTLIHSNVPIARTTDRRPHRRDEVEDTKAKTSNTKTTLPRFDDDNDSGATLIGGLELDDLTRDGRSRRSRRQLPEPQPQSRRRATQRPDDKNDPDTMKFSHSIQFNAVPDWSTHYIAYSNLKKLYVMG